MGEKIFWCEEIVCYGYGRNRTGDLFFVRYVLAESWLKGCTGRTVFSKIFWCGVSNGDGRKRYVF